MKKFYFFTFYLFVLSYFTFAQIPTDSLVGYWPFNGNANDESGNGNDGTVNGATLTSDRFGNANSAYDFDGVDDYIQSDFDEVLGSASRSVCVWATLLNFNVGWSSNIYCFGDGGTGGGTHAFKGGLLSFPPNEGVAIDNNGSRITYQANNVADSLWHFYTWVFDNSIGTSITDVSVYQDGVLLTNIIEYYIPFPAASQINTTTGNIIGCVFPGIGYLHGEIDDLRIFNRAISQQEIDSLYLEGQTWSCGASITYEGQEYSTVQIGNQCWMAENLNAGTRIDGNIDQTDNGIIEKYSYDNLESNCDEYGGLYYWDEMMQYTSIEGAQGICPTGWYVPSALEWQQMADYLGGDDISGGKLKEAGYTHWLPPNTGATNESGYTALPAGCWRNVGWFDFIGGWTYIWSSSVFNDELALSRNLNLSSAALLWQNHCRDHGFSVRCLKDEGSDSLNTCFSGSPLQGEVPLNVQFTEESIGNPTIWKWDFENDGVYDSYIQNPSHIYSDTGIYSVKLVIENGTETDSLIKYNYITVNSSVNDLIAYYPFNGNANDESGNGNDGTVYGSTLTTDRFGNSNSAYDFDGVDDYIQLPANTYFTGDFTFSGWVYLESYNNLCVYYDFGNGNGNNTVRSIPVDQTTPSYHMQIFENYNGENLFCDEYIILNSWKHLVNVLNGNQLSFYIDGNFINTVTTNYIPLNVIRSINYFAKSSYSGASYTNAIYDDIRIYNRVLSPQEIDSLYHEGGWDDFICDFSASPISGNAPLNVNFTDQSIGNPTIWKWDFENDGVYDSYIQNPSHIYSDTGTYSVKLVIENGTETDSLIKYNYITVNSSVNDLVAYYPFNGNANDESGNGNNGIVYGATLTTDRFGNQNSSYSFDGTDEIRVTSSTSLENFSNMISISSWVYIEDYYIGRFPVVDKYIEVPPTAGSSQFLLIASDDPNVGFNFQSICVGYLIYGKANQLPLLNVWLHITSVYDGDSVYIYTNGIKSYVNPSTGNLCVNGGDLLIGHDDFGNDEWAIGKIDDIRIYNRVLSPQEIDSLYHEGGWDEIVCYFSASPLSGNQPLNVNFTDLSTGNPTIWKWDFENDGVFDAFIQNPSHTYNQEGSYSVKLVVENSTDSDTLIKFNYITVTSGSGSIGLIAYYPFNGNADDESGNGHHGIVHGATVTVNRFGIPSSAYDFDDTNDYISSIIGNYDTVSVSFWYKASYPDKWYPTFFSYFQTGFLGQYGDTLSPPYTPCDVLCYPANSGLQNLPIPAFDEWHHVYMDIDNIGNTQMVYVDGLYDSTYIGVPGISPGNGFHMSVGDPAGNPLQFFTGSLDDFRIYDKRLSEDEIIELYQESEIETPSICIVSVDDNTNENLVVWEKQITTAIDSFRIYRESTQANVFEYIGSVAYEDSSLFLDETSIPVQRAYKYKISSLGITGEESLLSNYHKTIHLTISPGPYGMNLNWDQYEGFDFGTYYIYKGNSPNNFVIIDYISSNFTSYTDIYPPWGNMYYLIEIINPNGCFPSKNSDYSRSRSNVVFNPQVSIAENNNENFLIYPVPSHDYVIISSDNDIKENVKIKLLDLNGRVLFEEKRNLDKIILNLTSLKPGIYLINIVGNNINIIRKIVKY